MANDIEKKMKEAAANLEFEKAAALRDELLELRKQIGGNESLLFPARRRRSSHARRSRKLVGNLSSRAGPRRRVGCELCRCDRECECAVRLPGGRRRPRRRPVEEASVRAVGSPRPGRSRCIAKNPVAREAAAFGVALSRVRASPRRAAPPRRSPPAGLRRRRVSLPAGRRPLARVAIACAPYACSPVARASASPLQIMSPLTEAKKRCGSCAQRPPRSST
jgi:hypothetical protein